MMTPEERKVVEEIKRTPGFRPRPGMTDEDILAAARFLETGEGVEVYGSEEEYRAAKRREKIDTIDEV